MSGALGTTADFPAHDEDVLFGYFPFPLPMSHAATPEGGAGTNAPAAASLLHSQRRAERLRSSEQSSCNIRHRSKSLRFRHGGPAVPPQRPFDRSAAQGEEQSKMWLIIREREKKKSAVSSVWW